MGYIALSGLGNITHLSTMSKRSLPSNLKSISKMATIMNKFINPAIEKPTPTLSTKPVVPTIKEALQIAQPVPSLSKPYHIILPSLPAPTSVLRPAIPGLPTARPGTSVLTPVKPVVPAVVNKSLIQDTGVLDNASKRLRRESRFGQGGFGLNTWIKRSKRLRRESRFGQGGFGLNTWIKRSRMSNPDQKVPTTKSGSSLTAVEATVITGTDPISDQYSTNWNKDTTGLSISQPATKALIQPSTTGIVFGETTPSAESVVVPKTSGNNNLLIIASIAVAALFFLPQIRGR